MTEQISVVLCTHNGSRFIDSQLRSILTQNAAPDELVLSDDASSDDTVAKAQRVVEKFAPPGMAVTVLRNESALGVALNFEQAIRASSGQLIALSDQDDIWSANRVSRAVREFALRPKLDLLFSDARLVDQDGHSLERSLFDVLEIFADTLTALHDGHGSSVFIRRNVATGATIMFRRRLLESALPFPADWVHDEWLGIVASMVGQVDALEEQLIDYRQHSSNQIGVDYPTLRRKVRRTLESRGARNARLSGQFSQLMKRFEERQDLVSIDQLARLRAKSNFESARLHLPGARARRVRQVLNLYRRGWYDEFASQGKMDMLRDLLQSHRD